MSITLSYPGVYIEEVPSGVRTITGVATSITAFIGRSKRGPTNAAMTINNFGDFERIFGGLWQESQLGFAVRDFFLNGGSQAIVVRLFRAQAEDEEEDTPASKSSLSAGGLTLEAAYEGAWGANLRASVDKDGISDEVASALGLSKSDLFNLSVRDASPGGATERFLNLSVKESPRRIDRVLAAESTLARLQGTLDPAALPAVTAGSDNVTAAEAALATARKALAEKLIAGEDASAEATAVGTAETTLNTRKQNRADAVSDGESLRASDFLPANGETDKAGLYALEQADLFNILCVPPYKTSDNVNFDVDGPLIAAATVYCEKRRAFFIIDPPSNWKTKGKAKSDFTATSNDFPGVRSKNAALFFPRLMQPNPLREGRIEPFAPCGVVAGIFARTDTQRGVWKAPAGTEATLVGVPQLEVALTDAENGELNPLGINCLRAFPVAGRVVWGSRTLRGADQLADEWKYVPVRRTALFIEESLYRGTQWVVFEPNDEPLWSQIRLNVGAFMHGLFRQGAFQGTTPRDAYFVKCDKETTSQNDIDRGVVNIAVGFAPLKPAEFVVIRLQQIAGQIQA
jgi:uncharacterized protein